MILKRFLLGMTVLGLLLFSAQAFGQNAGIAGVVTDQSGGVLQGAKVTVKNTATSVTQDLVTNSSGQYKASALQVGNYTVTAEKEGFASQTKADIRIGASANLNVDFKLEIGRAKTEVVEVNVATENLILESGSSIGVVLPEDKINQLPLVNSNVLDLVKVMGGVVYGDRSPIFYADDTTLAGLSASNVNVQKDGVTANDVRWATGMNTPVNLNPESIGEFKVIITPVDAEMGRGSGQVQVVTRSGSNAYHGSAVWNVQNSFLDGNQWFNNKQRVTANWRNQNEVTLNANGPIFKNKTFFFVLYNQQWAMIKNNNLNVTQPTQCAKKGVYRYFDGYLSGNFQQVDPSAAQITAAQAVNGRYNAPLTARVVDSNGNPLVGQLPVPHYGAGSAYNPTTNPTGAGTYSPTPTLRATSVFGPILNSAWNPATDPECAQVPVVTDKTNQYYGQIDPTWVNYSPTNGWASQWDQYRKRDTTGYVGPFLDLLDKANNFDVGDGLNTAGLRWTRRNTGVDNVYGIGEAPNRKQINFRVDHNFNSKQRVSVSYIYEKDKGEDAMPNYPQNSYGGSIDRTPQTLSAALTSTLKPTLLNEFRIGLTRTNSWVNGPLMNPATKDDLRSLLNTLMPTTNWPGYQNPTMKDLPVLIGLTGFTLGTANNFNPYGSGRGNMGTDWGSIDPRWDYADTVTLTLGRHSFRMGGEMQRTKSDQKLDGQVSFGAAAMVYPEGIGGYNGPANTTFYNAAAAVPTTGDGSNRYALPGMVGSASSTHVGNLTNLLNTMSGSLGSLTQFYFTNHPTATSYNDIRSGDVWQYTYFRQNQMNFFVQDNWRVTDDLTLNLGMRYEWYGVPYLGNGMTSGIKGNALNGFALSGRSWKNWMNLNWKPGDPIDNAYKNCDAANSDASGKCKLAEMAFIGPESPNPGQQLYNDDYNNFGPVFGFAYTLPWGGKGKTVLRGGIQINYMTLGRANATNAPGLTYTYTYAPAGQGYLDLSMMSGLLPLNLPSSVQPPFANPIPAVGLQGSVGLTVYDPNLRSPYTQSLNLILTRTIGSSLTVDIRYAGNLSRKSVSTINLNAPNYITNGLIDAFTEARAAGMNVGGAWQTTPIPTAANQPGNPALLDKLLWGVNIAGVTTGTGVVYGPVGTTVVQPNGTSIYQSGAYQLRNSTSTMGSLANGNFSGLATTLSTLDLTAAWNTPAINTFASTTLNGEVLRAAGMPENYIQASRQFSAVTYNGNFNHNNYHSMQAQVTLRPTHGLGLSATYTWSRQLGSLGYTDYGNRAADYGVTGGRNHAFTSYGTFDLPFGPNRWLASGVSPNILGRIIGGWQMSWIHTMNTGSYMSVTGQSSLWGGSQPDKVAEFDNKQGYVKWLPNASTGTYFDNKYSYATDPQCRNLSVVAASLQSQCTLNAVNLTSNPTKFVFQNALPGIRGNYDRNSITGPGQWNTDMALSKSIRISEGKSFSLRVDATNVFNHTQPTYQTSASTGSRSATGNNPPTSLGAVFEMSAGSFYFGNRPMGYMDSKFGCRTFQAKIRFDF